MRGKDICKVLKQVRKDIADKNSIPFEIEECTHQGECKGTCPRCESEVRYLERELKKRRSLGKKVALAGISAAVVVGTTGCESIDMAADRLRVFIQQKGNVEEELSGMIEPQQITEPDTEEEMYWLEGDVAMEIETDDIEEYPVEGKMDQYRETDELDIEVLEGEEAFGDFCETE